ncbi:MAG: DegT/DnrJ/EryC1/StrS aminotransferase family protein [Caldicoprobacter oshimai]|nr:MAG: UDP-4-amino-4,6-dideoxy-N-acetyl-beta-L-altrosamine transaminase [Caldicoprobacter oshimai]
MRDTFLPFSPPMIGEEEIDEVVDTLRSEWITTGPKTKKFEDEFKNYFNAPAALALNSCTAALHISLIALGIGPGDEVITTPMTFCSTVNVIEHVGARPVLVDVQPDTLNIDPEKIEKAITPRTKAILPVHYAGHPADLDYIYEIAKKHNLFVIEDAAHAVSAKYKGRFIGSGNNPVCFSFYATKNLTTAEGGMLTGDPEFVEKARVISLHGMSKDAWKRYSKEGSWYYEVVMPGFKYNMTDIQASMGIWQLKKLERFQARRREIVRMYNEHFSKEEALEIPIARPYVEHAWHLYALRLNTDVLQIGRNEFIDELAKRNIGASVHFIPVHVHPYYRKKYGYKPDDFPVAYSNYLREVSIPLCPRLTDEDVYDVIEAIMDIVKVYKR